LTGAARPAALLVAVCLGTLAESAAAAEVGFKPIELTVTPIDAFARASGKTVFGALEFRGGLEVSSSDPDFGALSGLDLTPDGDLLAVSDTGLWFTARPIEDGGRIVGLADPRLAPILDGNGKPVAGKLNGDAEGLRIQARDGGRIEALVSFERKHGLRRFVAQPDFAHASGRSVRLPKSMTNLTRNAGIEALAVAPAGSAFAGATLMIAERSLDQAGNHRGWITGGPRAGSFALVRSDDFDVTDAAFLADGDLLVLERRYSLLAGPAVRIRRIATADLLPHATVDGRILIQADMGYQIDNMEGMALRPGAGGETRILLISDDNKSLLQRTILLEFALPADAVPRPRMRADAGQ